MTLFSHETVVRGFDFNIRSHDRGVHIIRWITMYEIDTSRLSLLPFSVAMRYHHRLVGCET